jgi:hypothetical protein
MKARIPLLMFATLLIRRIFVALCIAPAVLAAATAPRTDILMLSGDGTPQHPPVRWEFTLDSGRGSGVKSSIVVPSCWEQQGFGAYYYGTQGRGKPDDDPIIPKETGSYARSFMLPPAWSGREIHIVFDGAMTDTDVRVNGQSAGPTHQGGFYRFSYDITKLVHTGKNQLEVRVAKESANPSVNRAERRGDYWTFGGIFRPVWLEARPADNIEWTAIDARADGSFAARVHLNRRPPPGAMVTARVTRRDGDAFGGVLHSASFEGDTALVTGKFAAPALWTAETPHLYDVAFALRAHQSVLHEKTERFGFRTFEVRPNDGLYLNGRKIVLKGINRHSFNSRTGRTLTLADQYTDVRLIKLANMNAVRMSHYPPDAAFLDVADELGLYVLDELAGWQGAYDTPTGARLIGEIIRRDVNHPGILFWDNGNEGGWNTDNDGEFAKWDPQARPVLHPWAIHDGINTDHYETYDSTVHLSAGPQIFMPTEFLHGLYDGGIGAGFRDYWDVMGRSPTVGGGFFWSFVDEGIRRTDRGGRIDTVGNAAPDGMLGPDREKEGSFFTVREIWSPVQVRELNFAPNRLRMRLENGFDFRNLAELELHWRALRMPVAGSPAAPRLIKEGWARAPDVAPHSARDFELPIGLAELGPDDIIELSAREPRGPAYWTWVVRSDVRAEAAAIPAPRVERNGESVVAGAYTLTFDPGTGELAHLKAGDRDVPLTGPHFAAWQRESKANTFTHTEPTRLTKLEVAPADGSIARARYEGPLREVTWRLRGDELVVSYEIAYEGPADILGMQFEFPESAVTGKRWVGEGPYRIWKNRLAGTQFGLHAANYSRSTPGETFEYPEFEGYFGRWRWLEMQTRAGAIVFRNESDIPYFGLYRPTPVEKPLLVLPDVGWAFLHAVPPIGTKFNLPDVLGPESQPAVFNGTLRGELALRVLR